MVTKINLEIPFEVFQLMQNSRAVQHGCLLANVIINYFVRVSAFYGLGHAKVEL